MKLTRPQELELRRLADGRQQLYGKGRLRVQVSLLRQGFARFVDLDGKPAVSFTAPGFAMFHRCAITEAGKKALESL